MYCSPTLSSRWAVELKDERRMTGTAMQASVDYVYKNLGNLKMLYLCGGEPMMMKENIKLLQIIKESNPQLDIRVNTNLSNLDNEVFRLLETLPNVHWILSAEATYERFEYIRYPLNWETFVKNVKVVLGLDHKISLNMSWNILNAFGIFDFIDQMLELGLHQNSIVINAVTIPEYYNISNLPSDMLSEIKQEAVKRHGRLSEPFMLKYSYEAIIKHCNEPIMNKQQDLKQQLATLDSRRSLDSKKVFPELYKRLLG